MTTKKPKTDKLDAECIPENASKPSAPEDLIGERIATLRLAKKLNHDGLARLTKLLDKQEEKGINRTTIRGYEVGMYKPGARELRLLSEALEVSPAWLLLGTGDSAPVLEPEIRNISPSRYREVERLIRIGFLLPWIDKSARESLYDLIATMARLSLGEEKFRAENAMLTEMASTVVDYIEDFKETKQPLDMEKMKPVLEQYMKVAAERFDKLTPK